MNEYLTSKELVLNNGVSMPRFGLGVFRSPQGSETRTAVSQALQLGYRHIDTARIYRNEADVGVGLQESGIPREEIFVTTKLWNEDHGYDAALRAFQASQEKLGLEVIDLYLLHWPVPGLRLDSWRALESLYESGQVRAIGVSNFMVHHLEELFAHARILPMVNQIEVHPFLQQREVCAWCAERNIVITAYSPLAKATVLTDTVVTAVAAEAGMTPAQAMLVWGLQKGYIVLVKSVHRQRQIENLKAVELSLTSEQIARLDELERGLVTGWDPRNAP
jgi:methylglyoxal/glyoxal reductase